MSKRHKHNCEKVTPGKQYLVMDAIKILQETTLAKFVESVDVSIKLGIDAKKSDQAVRGACVLPHGSGKKVKVAVFAQGDKADNAKEAGADLIGFEDLAEKIKQGELDFDVLIATPDAMRLVGQLGQVLGPKGLMPNPKMGTVTVEVAEAVKKAKSGQARYRSDKAGIVHCSIGKINFKDVALKENLTTLINELRRVKPSSSKGTYLQKITLSTTMGPSLIIDQASLDA